MVETVERDQLGGEKKKEAMMGMLRMVKNVCTLPSVRKTFIPVDEECFLTYARDAHGSVNGY